MHFTDSIVAITLLVLFVMNESIKEQFVLRKADWLNGYLCKLVGVFALLATQCNTLTALMMAIERYVIIHNPLEAEYLTEKLRITLNPYLSLSLIPSID